MEMQMNNPTEVLRQGLNGQRPVDDAVLMSAAVLSDRLELLKRSSPMFEAISFSPEVEAMVEAQYAAAAN